MKRVRGVYATMTAGRFERNSQKMICKHTIMQSEGVTVVMTRLFSLHIGDTVLLPCSVVHLFVVRVLTVFSQCFRNVGKDSATTCFLQQEVTFWVPFAGIQVSLHSYGEAMGSKFTFNS